VTYRYVSQAGCTGMAEKQVYVYGPVPAIHLIPADTVLHPEGYVDYDAGPGFDAYYWTTGELTQKVRIRYGELPLGTDTVRVVGVTGGCSSVGDAVITFEKAAGMVTKRVEPLKIYPNPAHKKASIDWQGAGRPVVVEVFNQTGKKVLSRRQPVCTGKCVINLNVSRLKPGIYFVRLEKGTELYFSKMIVR